MGWGGVGWGTHRLPCWATALFWASAGSRERPKAPCDLLVTALLTQPPGLASPHGLNLLPTAPRCPLPANSEETLPSSSAFVHTLEHTSCLQWAVRQRPATRDVQTIPPHSWTPKAPGAQASLCAGLCTVPLRLCRDMATGQPLTHSHLG